MHGDQKVPDPLTERKSKKQENKMAGQRPTDEIHNVDATGGRRGHGRTKLTLAIRAGERRSGSSGHLHRKP